ncbi:hypothetical protein JAAARDRAFT_37618 [Jaapia argillacea MUCL 33604]|uniref:Uncharacterized protein n=1 Tax=Jaapia argillacea MUCL 33604 TaxID=933084 RepID=A0A067PXL8_9AGAM|nr:hypothetical protein JAAARDRAFT_37618 [Jaapia argillacea MUCL 33604]
MSFDADTLEPKIREILSAPGTDLTTISAKRVRKQLMELDSSLTSTVVKENKDEIDRVIAEVFEKYNEEVGGGDGGSNEDEENGKRRRDDTEDEHGDEHHDGTDGEEREEPPKKKAKKGSKAEPNDAEIARQLQNELNGRARSSRAAATGKAKSNGAKKGTKKKKSAATVDSDGEEGEGSPKKKKAGGGGAKGGFAKEYGLSESLAAVVGVDKLSRPQVVKQLWVYIKGNELQNPENKKEIMCDEKLRAVFSRDKIDMFTMNKVLGQHLHAE